MTKFFERLRLQWRLFWLKRAIKRCGVQSLDKELRDVGCSVSVRCENGFSVTEYVSPDGGSTWTVKEYPCHV